VLRTRVIDVADITAIVVVIVTAVVLLVLTQQPMSQFLLALLLQLLPQTLLLLQHMVDRIPTLAQQLDVPVAAMDVFLSVHKIRKKKVKICDGLMN
jgi:hypothetical protein